MSLNHRGVLAVFACGALATLAGCGDSGQASGDGGSSGPPTSPDPSPDPDVPTTGGAGTLTAGVWDDNRNFDYYSAYVDSYESLDPGFTAEERIAAHDRADEAAFARATLDIALVLDTTGSMSDELSYLQVEFDAIAAQIEALYPQADQRWGFVAYRDIGDAYIARTNELTADLATFQAELAGVSAAGGGDYPEAADEGLRQALQLDWRDDANGSRLIFWIADAPHHSYANDDLVAAVRDAAERDVHIYPIASSGVDELTELTMRSTAQLTLGRYLFLTDDSGIGDSHKEPTIPCYFVTRLDHAMLRMVDIEMTGEYREPDPTEIIRTGGNPLSGVCTFADGQQLNVF